MRFLKILFPKKDPAPVPSKPALNPLTLEKRRLEQTLKKFGIPKTRAMQISWVYFNQQTNERSNHE
jgi:hypothetical protein